MVERFDTLSAVVGGGKSAMADAKHKISYQFEAMAPKISILMPPEEQRLLPPSLNNTPQASTLSMGSDMASCDRPKVARNMQLKLQVVKIAMQLKSLQKKQSLHKQQEQANKQNCAYLCRNDRGELLRHHSQLKKIKEEQQQTENVLKYQCRDDQLIQKENALASLQQELSMLQSQKLSIERQLELQAGSLKQQPTRLLECKMDGCQRELEKVTAELRAAKLKTTQLRREFMHMAIATKTAPISLGQPAVMKTQTGCKQSIELPAIESPRQHTENSVPEKVNRSKLDDQLKKLRQQQQQKHKKLVEKQLQLQQTLMRVRHLKETLLGLAQQPQPKAASLLRPMP